MSRAPLVDIDVDLRDFPFMPIDITRLFGSEFHAVSDDASWRAGVTLWLKSYHQVPASSVSGNDLALAKLAEVSLSQWKEIKKAALRGWVKCSDGRFYHPVVAEKALEGWIEKLVQRKASAAGNAKRYGNDFDASPYDDAINRAKEQLAKLNPRSRTLAKRHGKYQTLPHGSQSSPTGSPTGSETGVPVGSQETGKGQGREEITDNIYLSPSGRASDVALQAFFDAFPRRAEPDGVKRELGRRLRDGVPMQAILEGARRYRAKCENRTGDHVASPVRWLVDGRWADDDGAVTPSVTAPANHPDKTFVARSDPRWERLEERYRSENRKTIPARVNSWYFDNTWIQELCEEVT